MIFKIKQLISHFFALRIKNIPSTISGNLEINLVYGRKYLDTKSTNYSYGPLQRILKYGLEQADISKMHIEKVLLLGMGAGSVVESLRKDFNIHAPVDCVEIDSAVIDIAEKEFDIYQYAPICIYQADAFDFITNCDKKYDLIIIDIFVIDTIPEIFTEKPFISAVSGCLKKQGKILFNTMQRTLNFEKREKMQQYFTESGLKVSVTANIEDTNSLIIAFKP